MTTTSALLVVASGALLFCSCRIFLQKKLYKDLQQLAPQDTLPASAVTPQSSNIQPWHSTLAQTCFSLCFSECSVLFFMLMCQGLDLLEPSVRLLSWQIALVLLLLTILLLVPISFSLTLTYRPDNPGFVQSRALPIRIAFALAPVALINFALSYIPLPAELLSHHPLTVVTARLVTMGTTILGLLSGLGAVGGAWGIINRPQSVPSASSIASAENALGRVMNDLQDRSHELDDYMSSKPQPDGSWLSRMSFKRNSQQVSLQQEVIGLQALQTQMSLRVSTLKHNRVAAEYAESFIGKSVTWSWAVYCVCRVCGSVFNILFPSGSTSGSSTSYGDIVAHILAWLFSYLPFAETGDVPGEPHFDIPSLSKQISLSLVGIIILCSLRLVLRGVTRAFHVTSRKTSASLMLLTLAQLMGIYLLSTLVQLRTTFPPAASSILSDDPQDPTDPSNDSMNLFATLPEYSLFGGLFDWSFLIGAAGCALARWARSSFRDDGLDM